MEQDKKNTGDDEKEEGKNDTEEGTIDIEKEKEEDEVNSGAEKSDEPKTISPGKTENVEQSPVTAMHDVLVGGVSAWLIMKRIGKLKSKSMLICVHKDYIA